MLMGDWKVCKDKCCLGKDVEKMVQHNSLSCALKNLSYDDDTGNAVLFYSWQPYCFVVFCC